MRTIQLLLLLSISSAVIRADVILDVVVNTTGIEGQPGYLAFDFIGGTPIENNTATISNFSTDALFGTLTTSGDAFGSVSPGPGTLDDVQFFNEFLQAATFGSNVSFVLDLTTNAAGVTIPDSFAFYLLDSSQNPYPTSDPSGASSIFEIDIDGSNLSPNVYASGFATATVTPAGTVPEPPYVAIAVAGVVGLMLRLKVGDSESGSQNAEETHSR